MKFTIKSSISLVLLVSMLVVGAGCKSKKKAMEASNAAKEKARIEQEAALRKQQEEEAKRKEAEERERREAELKREAETKIITPRTRLSQYFEAISTSTNVASANNSINEALTMFASPEAPVLIVISEYDGKKDYDKPTTIKNYLNYLKDQKKNINAIAELKVDGSGKITEVELRKNL
jgi:hypothetical protein